MGAKKSIVPVERDTPKVSDYYRRIMSKHKTSLGAWTPARWLGVFARDELPELDKEARPFALVLNTDPRTKPGQHWLAIFGPEDGPIELFDSFGLAPSTYHLEHLSPAYSTFTFQSLRSSCCGHYCIYFLYLRAHSRIGDHPSWSFENQSFAGVMNYLKNVIDPDKWVVSYVGCLQRTYRALDPYYRSGQCSKLKCTFC